MNTICIDKAADGYDIRAATPFQAMEARRLLSRRHDLTPVPAQALYEGTVWGDEVWALSPEALEFGMHSLIEIEDICAYDDNGSVVLFPRRGRLYLPEDGLLLLMNAEPGERRKFLPSEVPPPSVLDIGDIFEPTRHEKPHPDGGYVIVLEEPATGDHIVAWRRDLRIRRNLRGISRHSREEFAVDRIPEAIAQFEPAALMGRSRSRRLRDYQRQKVYEFESRLGERADYARMGFETVEDCRAYLAEVYEDLNLGSPPDLREGRGQRSYFRMLDGVTLADWGMERWVVLHEAAHHIAHRITWQEPGHGPTFVGVLITLLERFAGVDHEMALDEARRGGIDVNSDIRERLLDRVRVAPSP